MALWIFGDSFSAPEDNKNDFDPWYEIVAKTLNQPIQNKSVFGAGFQYILNQWNTYWNQIKVDDYVIVILTSARKTCFFKDHPQLSMPWMINKAHYAAGWHLLSSKQQTAFKSYYKHLHCDNDIITQMQSFLFWANTKSAILDHKIIVVKSFNDFEIDHNCFNNLIISTGGSLIELSRLEVSETSWDLLLINNDCFDTRSNHLTEENHINLAACIVNSIGNFSLDLNFDNFKIYNAPVV